jgi:hypothetical protein
MEEKNTNPNTDKGYVKLYRSSVANGWLSDHKLWAVWCWCLLKASHHEHKVVVGRREIILQSGQFVFGRHEASKELKIAPSTLYEIMIWLKNAGNIGIHSNNKFSVITIVKWHTYQTNTPKNRQHDRQQTDNKPTTNRHKQEGEEGGVLLSPSKNGDCPHQQIISLYHELLPMCPSIKEWTDTRQQNLRARWKSSPDFQNLGWWKGFFEYIATSKFLTGQIPGQNGKPFLASLPWIIKPENFAKIREGMYE